MDHPGKFLLSEFGISFGVLKWLPRNRSRLQDPHVPDNPANSLRDEGQLIDWAFYITGLLKQGRIL